MELHGFGRRAALAAAAIAGLGLAAAAAVPASAAVSPLTATVSASSDGSATCSASGAFVLKTGAAVSTTFAQAVVNGVSGTHLASVEPSFVTDNYNAGSPRWVIELNNGKSLWGYPPNSNLNGTDFAWTVDNGNTYTSYATAYAAAGAATSTIKDAFIVADGDQVSTTDTITDVTFNGAQVSCMEAAASPSATSSASSGSGGSTPGSTKTPVGGVQTGGGKPSTNPALPIGIAVVVVGLFSGLIVAARRKVGKHSA